MLREILERVAKEYEIAKNQPFSGHPLARYIRDAPKAAIQPLLMGVDLIVVGSPGKGNWAEIPWIAIYNKNETDGPQEGLYVVYLFSKDRRRIYLALGQGVSRPIERDGRSLAIRKIRARTDLIQTSHPFPDFSSDEDIKISETGLGADYEKATVYYRAYDVSSLPSDEILEADLKKVIAFYDRYLEEASVLTAGTDFSGDTGLVEEGKRKLKEHYVRERSSKVIKDAKAVALRREGKLSCEICGFTFVDHYGDRASNYIEGHHTKPVSQMQAGEKTKIEDIALVCSNCHRVIHQKMPWLSLEELRLIYH